MSFAKRKRKFRNEQDINQNESNSNKIKNEPMNDEENNNINYNKNINNNSNNCLFGNITLKKKEWKLFFECCKCDELIGDFHQFLHHSLKHLYDIDYEAIEQLLKCLLKNSNKSTFLKEENVNETINENTKSIIDNENQSNKDSGSNLERSSAEEEEEEELEQELMVLKTKGLHDPDIMEFLYSDGLDEGLLADSNKSLKDDASNDSSDGASDFSEDTATEESSCLDAEVPTKQPKAETEANNNIFLEENCNSLEIEYVNEITFTESAAPSSTFVRKTTAKSSLIKSNKTKNQRQAQAGNQSDYICQECGKTFPSKQALRNHEKRHFARFFCDMCDSVFNEAVNLKVHRYRHLGIQPHKCELCDKSFTTTTEVKLHMRSHTGEKPYVCDTCGVAYATSSHLVAHRMRHSSVRPHPCSLCDKNFYNKRELNIHLRTHTNERPYNCPNCDKTFKTHHALSQHKKLHLPFKSYKCLHCDKEFAQMSGYRFHMKRNHQNLTNGDSYKTLSLSDMEDEEIQELVNDVTAEIDNS